MKAFLACAVLLGGAGVSVEGARLTQEVRVAAFNTVSDEARYPSGPQIEWITRHSQPSDDFDIVGVIENMRRESEWDSVPGFTTFDFAGSGSQPEQLLYRTDKFRNPTNTVQFAAPSWGRTYVSHVDLEESVSNGGCVRVFAVHFPIEKSRLDGPDDLLAYEMAEYVASHLSTDCSNIVTGDMNTIRLNDFGRNYKRLDALLDAGLEPYLAPERVQNVMYVMADMAVGSSAEVRESSLSDHPIATTICSPAGGRTPPVPPAPLPPTPAPRATPEPAPVAGRTAAPRPTRAPRGTPAPRTTPAPVPSTPTPRTPSGPAGCSEELCMAEPCEDAPSCCADGTQCFRPVPGTFARCMSRCTRRSRTSCIRVE